MTERAIQVGDLVQVVRGCPCCGATGVCYGQIFVVTSIFEHQSHCGQCGRLRIGMVADGDFPVVVLVSKLKRIPPLSELEGERSQESITLPGQRPKEPA